LTAKKLIKTENKDEAAKLEVIIDALDALGDTIVVFDKSFNYVFLNKTGWEVIGLSKSEVLGKNVWKLMPHLKGSYFEKAAIEAMKEQKKLDIEEYYPHTRKWYRTYFYPFKTVLLLHITDITDLKNALEINSKLMGNLHDAMEVYWSEDNKALREKHREERQIGK
jgi:PAS domain S-box-containing protein